MTKHNPYKVLGVPRDAGVETIHTAYRRLAKRWHPDRNPGNAQAEDRFKEIAAAYEILSDAERRAQYDRDNPPPSDGHRGERPYYSPDVGYSPEPDWPAELAFEIEKQRQARTEKRIKPNPWLLALAAWIAFAFANDMLRGFASEFDGVIISKRRAGPPLMDALLYFGPTGFLHFHDRVSNRYEIRSADGHLDTFLPGPVCSFLSGAASAHLFVRDGSRISKQVGHWTYEVDGRFVSEFPSFTIRDGPLGKVLFSSYDCFLGASLRLIDFLVLLTLGLVWRPAWKRRFWRGRESW